MKKMFLLFYCLNSFSSENIWAVIGAGPAGIITVSMLLDIGTPATNILWIDPEFNAGELSLYPTVSSNNKTKIFVDFLRTFKTYQEISDPSFDNIFYKYDPAREYELEIIIKPLHVITEFLLTKVSYIKDRVASLSFKNNNWHIELKNGKMCASHVVLATGSHPRKLDLHEYSNLKEISLVDALDYKNLSNQVTKDDTVAVFGSAHSAVLILKNLCDLGVKKIVNFYNKTLIEKEGVGLWYSGISNTVYGLAASWSKENLEGENLPSNLCVKFYDEDSIRKELPNCTKVIFAIGFERNLIPFKDNCFDYNPHTGVIDSRLFGIGIAFPEKYFDQQTGKIEAGIGIPYFVNYALRVVPEWAKTKKNYEFLRTMNNFNELLEIRHY